MLSKATRIAVLAACGLETLAVIVILLGAILVRSDPAGEGMSHAYAAGILVLWVLMVLPAGVLAWRGRWLWVAAGLAGLPLAALALLTV